MFDRLTDSAVRALELARDEARSAGHECVDIDHILLGVLCEEGGATRVLRRLGVDADSLRDSVAFAVGGKESPENAAFSDDAIRTLELAMEEAGSGFAHYIGSEHLLAAILRSPESSACWMLARCSVNLAQVREEIRRMAGLP